MENALEFIFPNQWHVIGIVAALLFACTELGFFLARRTVLEVDDALRSQVNGAQASVLGLLGLLLGFTLAMALTRYEKRTELVLAEANAIGTTFLRASFLPAPHRAEVEELLRRYVDGRLEFYDAGADPARIRAAEAKSAAIQEALWEQVRAAAPVARPAELMALFVAALNDTIDADAKRLAAYENRVPATVWFLLMIIAALGSLCTGYAAGLARRRILLPMILLPVVFTTVIAMVVDLDRPRRGLIVVSQKALVHLKESMTPRKAP